MSTPQPPGTPQPPPQPRPAAPPPANEPDEDSPSNWQPWLYVKLGLVGLAIAYLVAFIVENTDEIKIEFVFADAQVHLIWALLLVLGLGILLGVLLSQLYRHRVREELQKRSRKKADARADLVGRDEAERKPG